MDQEHRMRAKMGKNVGADYSGFNQDEGNGTELVGKRGHLGT